MKSNVSNDKDSWMPEGPKYPAMVGWLTAQAKSHKIEVRYASKFTLWAVFDESPGPMEVAALDIRVGDRIVSLGPCRVLSEADAEERVIWLVPSRAIHDLELMFTRQEVRLLPLELSALPLTEDYRQGVDLAFRDFLSDLMYGMNEFMTQLDKLDSEYRDELPLVQQAIQASTIAHSGDTFDGVLHGWNQTLLQFITAATPLVRDLYGRYFRRQAWSVLLRAPIFARSNLRSVHGSNDAVVQQMIHRNDHEGASTFGKLLHKFAVALPASQAVRNVQLDCAQILRAALDPLVVEPRQTCRVLAVTNGASLQWLEVLWNPAFSNLTLTLQGPDTGMLAEAAGWVRKLEQLHGVVFPVAYVLTPLEDLADAKKQPDDEGVFQFIFALGLLDSQIDRRAKAVIRTLYRWLCPGGELVLTNAVSDNPDQQVSEYWNDSRIYDRSEKQCLDLVSNLGDSNSVLSYDISKIEMMLRVAKPDLVKHEYFSVV